MIISLISVCLSGQDFSKISLDNLGIKGKVKSYIELSYNINEGLLRMKKLTLTKRDTLSSLIITGMAISKANLFTATIKKGGLPVLLLLVPMDQKWA
jgi:hypothetical protein